MAGRNVHTVPTGDQLWDWGVMYEKSSTYEDTFHIKAQAVEYGRELAIKEKSEHIIHAKDGTIERKISYGNDTFPPKG